MSSSTIIHSCSNVGVSASLTVSVHMTLTKSFFFNQSKLLNNMASVHLFAAYSCENDPFTQEIVMTERHYSRKLLQCSGDIDIKYISNLFLSKRKNMEEPEVKPDFIYVVLLHSERSHNTKRVRNRVKCQFFQWTQREQCFIPKSRIRPLLRISYCKSVCLSWNLLGWQGG